MKYFFTVHYNCTDIPLEAIFRFEITADTEEKAFLVARAYECQLRKDNPWFRDACCTMLRRT